MKAWAEFHPLVLLHVLGCPNPVMDGALRHAAREFCEGSKAWQETETFTGTGEATFEFDLPSQSELVQVMRATVRGKDVDIYGAHHLPADWQERPPRNPGLYHVDVDQYALLPAPGVDEGIAITFAIRPSLFGRGIGDHVFATHAETIAAGAAARLLKMPRQPWTDIEQAAIFRTEFTTGIGHAANRPFMQTHPTSRRVKKAVI